MSVPVVKICGLKSFEAAECAVNNGANLLGVIMVPGRSRTVDPDVALQISKMTHSRQKMSSIDLMRRLKSKKDLSGAAYFKEASNMIKDNGPYLVGVFRNQEIDDIKESVGKLGLDFVQLHGSENFDEYITALGDIPVIPRYVLNTERILDAAQGKKHIIPLLDSEAGGEGKLINWDDADKFGSQQDIGYLLAGGLTPENVSEAVKISGCLGVDVAGGVETDGEKDLRKIKLFIENATSI